MKKLLLFFAFTTFCGFAIAQEDSTKTWKTGGVVSLNMSQVQLENWNGGGQSSVSGTGLVNLFANWKKGRAHWDNTLDLGYGLISLEGEDFVKSDDRIELNSKFGQEAFKHWYYSALLNFRTQFAPGYEDPSDNSSAKISDFMSPAYTLLALGMDYKPSENFSLLISPATFKGTYVGSPALADAGAFGVDPAEFDANGVKTKDGSHFRAEIGGFLNMTYTRDLMENVKFNTKLALFSNYVENPENIDVNWETLISMKINKWLSASLATQLIYDHDIDILVEEETETTEARFGPRTQFKEVLAVGLSYQF